MSVRDTALNTIKGLMAVSLFTTLPVELYKFCISLQGTFMGDLARVFAGGQSLNIGDASMSVLQASFAIANQVTLSVFNLLAMIAMAYCVVKLFFANIKRGGILLIQIAVGAMYMFSVPRGFTDGFWGWCKQVAALCLTAFLQTTLLFLGLLTFNVNMLLGLGLLLSANEVPRIAQHSGLQKGNYREIKGLSVLFARIKRKYIANGGCRNAVAVAFCSQGAMQNISLFRKYLLRTG